MKKLHKILKKPITFMSSLHFQRNYGSAFFDRKKQVTKSSRRKCRSNLKNFDVKSIDMMNRTLYHGMIVFLQTRGISRSDHENHVASQYSHDCNSHTPYHYAKTRTNLRRMHTHRHTHTQAHRHRHKHTHTQSRRNITTVT